MYIIRKATLSFIEKTETAKSFCAHAPVREVLQLRYRSVIGVIPEEWPEKCA